MTTTKKRNIVASLAILLVATIVISATYAYFTDSAEVTNTFTVGNLDIDLEEPKWEPEKGEDLVPGSTLDKDPTVTAVKSDSYMRLIMTIVDKDATPDAEGNYPTVTDPDRLALILKTLYYDTTGSTIIEGTKYSLANIDAWLNAVPNPLALNPFNSVDFEYKADLNGVYTYWYKSNGYIFTEGTEVKFITSIVIPTDWTQEHLEKLGKYDIVFFAEAIQTEGFANATDAFDALDTQTPTP